MESFHFSCHILWQVVVNDSLCKLLRGSDWLETYNSFTDWLVRRMCLKVMLDIQLALPFLFKAFLRRN